MTKEEMISLMKKLAAEQGEAPTLVKFLEAGKLMTAPLENNLACTTMS